MILDCKTASLELKNRLLSEFSCLTPPASLLIVEVGAKKASEVYKRSIVKLAEEFGVKVRNLALSDNLSPDGFRGALFDMLDELDGALDGVVVERPLPPGFEKVVDEIPPELDIEGLSSRNLGNLALSPNRAIAPPTPQAAIFILDYHGINIKGKNCLVVGRSRPVGLPLALMLLQKGRDATVTIAHSKTTSLQLHTGRADIIFVSAGVPGLISGEMVKEGAIIIDIGINVLQDDDGRRIVGDVDFHSVLKKGCSVTPVPGGVGRLTSLFLMQNLLRAYKRRISDVQEKDES